MNSLLNSLVVVMVLGVAAVTVYDHVQRHTPAGQERLLTRAVTEIYGKVPDAQTLALQTEASRAPALTLTPGLYRMTERRGEPGETPDLLMQSDTFLAPDRIFALTYQASFSGGDPVKVTLTGRYAVKGHLLTVTPDADTAQRGLMRRPHHTVLASATPEAVLVRNGPSGTPGRWERVSDTTLGNAAP